MILIIIVHVKGGFWCESLATRIGWLVFCVLTPLGTNETLKLSSTWLDGPGSNLCLNHQLHFERLLIGGFPGLHQPVREKSDQTSAETQYVTKASILIQFQFVRPFPTLIKRDILLKRPSSPVQIIHLTI